MTTNPNETAWPSTENHFWQGLQQKVHSTAKSKGWWDDARPFGELIALMHSEVSEALEALRKREPAHHTVDGKPEGWGVELADVLIRICDACQQYDADLGPKLEEYLNGSVHPTLTKWRQWQQRALQKAPSNEGYRLSHMHLFLSNAYEAQLHWSKGETLNPIVLDRFVDTITEMFAMCEESNVDLEALVRVKMAFNETRPFKHGGKAF